jgi:hypothetical protein
MAFEIVLPPDTQNEIEEFVENYFIGRASQMAAVDALDREVEKLAANPTLGAVPMGTPLENRRIHRFTMTVGDDSQTVEYLYYTQQVRRQNHPVWLPQGASNCFLGRTLPVCW